MKNNNVYKIMIQIPSQGIERALPYEINSQETAEQAVGALNAILGPTYHHYSFSSTRVVMKKQRGIQYGRR